MRWEENLTDEAKREAISGGIAIVRDTLLEWQRKFGGRPLTAPHDPVGYARNKVLSRMHTKMRLYDAMVEDALDEQRYSDARKYVTARLRMRAAAIAMRETGDFLFPEE